MTKEEIQKEIEGMSAYIPVKKIEETLGMPPTTLQKVLKGERLLPKKWFKVLETYFCVPKLETIKINTENKRVNPEPKKKPQAINSYLQKRMNLKNGIK